MRHWSLIPSIALLLCGAAAPPPVTFTSYARQFDAFASATKHVSREKRVAAFRTKFDAIMPGLYADPDTERLNRRIAKALDEFASIRSSYREVERKFPQNFSTAVQRFRVIFPDFASPLPIYLVHELGMRDGGSDYVNGRKVMLFGTDLIAKFHNDESLQPFLDHELFHLEHGRHFADCDQFWCSLWQEGMATYAASSMTPHATDHQLMLDQPSQIRETADEHWGDALCLVATRFDDADATDIASAFTAGSRPPGLPARIGYYLGLKIVTEAARDRTLPALSRLSDQTARPVVVAALARLMAEADAPCEAPDMNGPITHVSPRPG